MLRTLATIEKLVASNETGTGYMMRMLPYRTADNVINGVVLTFTDITRISAAEQQIARLTSDLRSRIAELETLFEIVPVGVIITETRDASQSVINAYGGRLIGQADRQRRLVPITAPFRLFEGNGALEPNNEPLRRSARLGEVVPAWQGRLRTTGGRDVHVMISATPLFSDSQGVRGAIAAIVDMSAHKRAEEQQLLPLDELQHRVKNILATIASLAIRMAQRNRTGTSGGISIAHQCHESHARPAGWGVLERRQPAYAGRGGAGTVHRRHQIQRANDRHGSPPGREYRMLRSAGCHVIGPAPRPKQGLALAATPGLDGALLDVNLAGENCFPIADVLAARGVPFVFLTGYGTTVLPASYRDVPCLAKPYKLAEMCALVKRRFRPRSAGTDRSLRC